jgi:two-component system, sensor histidine kinase
VSALDSSAANPAARPTHPVRLLLVEDNDGVRLATQTYLRVEGYETLAAASVSEAERLFADLRPTDVVIADYHLDGKNTGLGMLEALRARAGYDVAGVVLSGDLPSVLRSIKSPVANCRFLSKPVDTASLVTAIQELSAAGSRDEHGGAGQVSRTQPG